MIMGPADTPGPSQRRATILAVVRHDYGRIANARAGKPSPCLGFGQVTTISAPIGGTLSRVAITSICQCPWLSSHRSDLRAPVVSLAIASWPFATLAPGSNRNWIASNDHAR